VSVGSWHFVAMEGFEDKFGGTVLEAVKREIELHIASAQYSAGGSLPSDPLYGQFGYLNGDLHKDVQLGVWQ